MNKKLPTAIYLRGLKLPKLPTPATPSTEETNLNRLDFSNEKNSQYIPLT
jgi:hypothetical protein